MNNHQFNDFDRDMMQQCIKLALQGNGKTSPNPLVGAIVVKDNQIIGRGFHPEAGQPHAEIFALREAGKNAQDSTIYVNLEPCNHFGRTPPCTEALIRAGVKKVMIGMIDPDERVAGGGIKRLKEAGIEVVFPLEEEACRQLNEAFIHRITYKSPFGILKYAMTLDGKIATDTGHSFWITGESSRNYVHQVRSGCDAIIIGGNTVRKDNPHLTTHGVSDHNPLRVVMTKSFDLPKSFHLWDTNTAKTVIFTLQNPNVNLKNFLLDKGVEIVEMESLTTTAVMQNLYDRGFSKVLWECGGYLSSLAIANGNIQKILAFISPKIIGGITSKSPIGDLGFTKMTEALKLEEIKLSQFDSDFLVEGYLQKLAKINKINLLP